LKLSVLHVYRTYFPDPPGGLQEAIRQIARATSAQGVENTIFTLSPQPEPPVLQQPEARVVRSRSWAAPASCDLGGLQAFTRFADLARETDVLHYLFPWPFADVLHNIIRPDRPAVLTYISDVIRQRRLGTVYAPLMWRMLRQMRVIVANSPAYAQTSPILTHPDIRDKVHVIPLGVDENSYPVAGDNAVFTRLGMSDKEPYFLFLGVLRYYKGLQFLLQAAKKMNARIVIAGSGPEGANLQSQVTAMALNNIVFAGQVTDAEKVALLKHCRALVLPSHLRSEAFGMVLVEASMFAKPMVCCELGTGTSFVNKQGETGWVVPPGSSEHLERALNTLLEDESLANSMGIAARQRYEKLFSSDALGRAYAELYKSVS